MQILLTNLQASSSLAISAVFARDRQVQDILTAGASIDIGDIATIDEVNRNTEIQSLVALGVLSVAATAESTDLGDLPTEEEVRAKTGWPIVDFFTGSAVSTGTPGTEAFTGRNLTQGQTFATTSFGTGTSSVSYSANRPGTPGNLITIVQASGAGEAISLAGGSPTGEITTVHTITVTSNNGVSTGNSIATLVNAHATAKLLVHATGGGTGTTLSYTTKNMDGGTGDGFKVYLAGLEQNVRDVLTDTACLITTVALSPAANGDVASLYVESDGTQSNFLTVNVAA